MVTIYLNRDKKNVTAMIATHAIVTELTASIHIVVHNFFRDNFFSSTELHDICLTKTSHALAQMINRWLLIVVARVWS
jgi:hypothetical protein